MLNENEIIFLKELGIEGDLHLLKSDSEIWADIEDKVADELELRGFDRNGYPNDIGIMCESILDKLPIE